MTDITVRIRLFASLRRFQPKDVGGEWTPDERSRIVEVFRRNETALCPDDSARLSVIPDPSLGATRLASVSCPICGKSFGPE